MSRKSRVAAAHTGEDEPTDDRSRFGRLVGILNNEPIVEIDGRRHRARSCVRLDATMLDREVVIVRPDTGEVVILGVLQAVAAPERASSTGRGAPGIVATQLGVEIDGDELVLSAKSRVTLRCGEAMLVLDQTGRVTIQGRTVVSHASGVNRIRGGAIQLN